MKTILLCFLMLFALVVPTFATSAPLDAGPPIGVFDLVVDLSTIAGVVAAILLITGWIKTAFKLEGTPVKLVSHVVGVTLSLLGYFFNIGIFESMTWWLSILTGVLCVLSANGAFTYDTVKYILSLFKAQILKE